MVKSVGLQEKWIPNRIINKLVNNRKTKAILKVRAYLNY